MFYEVTEKSPYLSPGKSDQLCIYHYMQSMYGRSLIIQRVMKHKKVS